PMTLCARVGFATKTALSSWWNTHKYQLSLPTRRPVSSDCRIVPENSLARIEDERAQVLSEGRSLGHVRRRRGLEFLRAVRAGSGLQRDAGHVRLDRRNLDVIVGLAGELRGLRDIGAAMLTGAGGNLAILHGIWMQRPMRASMRLAALFGARAFVLARGGGRGFLPLARRRAGIVRSLFRQIELGFEFGHTPRQTLDDLRLRQDQADQRLSVKRIKCGEVHRKRESNRDSPVNSPIKPKLY